MKKCISIAICVISTFASLNLANAKVLVGSADWQFDQFKKRFVAQLWKIYPTWASSVGYHIYDSTLVIPDEESRNRENRFCLDYLDSLVNYNASNLSPTEMIDYKLIKNQLQSAYWNLNELKAWQWDPSVYNVSGIFAEMLTNNFDDLDTRIHNFYRRMGKVPAYYAAAKMNISNPSIEHTNLAIDQNLGGIFVFENDLEVALKKSKINNVNKAKIRERAKEAVHAINDYVLWLKKLDNKNPRSFRLGKNLYDKKFDFDLQSAYTAEQMYQRALKRKSEIHEEMFELTSQLWPKYFYRQQMPANHLDAIRMMVDRLSERHVKKEEFQSAIEHQLPELVKFINKKQLLYIDPTKPLVVRKEPAYMAGVAGASISSPGPYDKNGSTFYNVGSLKGWSNERSESYLKEYNHYILQILNIHEAIPGHYTQLVYANRSPSIIKSILGCNSMIEGWAVYGERMMLENGYDGEKGVNSTESSPEMWLMYYKWHLRSVCNTILDYSVHVLDMQKNDAIKLLENEAFQQKTEAENKWKRVSVTQVQLCCYFTGFTEIYDLREQIKDNLGANFDLKKFHEQFLSFGSAPVKYIKELMLNDPSNIKRKKVFRMPGE